MRSSVLLSVAVACGVQAFELPTQMPLLSKSAADNSDARPQPGPNSVAIIGAGASGSSAAFWIGIARARLGLDIDVDVYEAQDYVGGRSTTVYPYGNKSLEPVELGASVYVQANKNMWRATDEFNLTRFDFEDDGADDDAVGIWDGETFPFTMNGGGRFGGWLDTARLIWRYGWTSPMRARNIVGDMIKSIVTLYKKDTPVWSDYAQLATNLKWSSILSRTTAEYFEVSGVSPMFTREMIEAATRVNYGQNVDKIHGLEGAVSMAANGVSSVKGGNWQVFSNFLNASGASVYLNTNVKFITKKPGKNWVVETSNGKAKEYKNVIIAAPFHQTGITLYSPTLDKKEKILQHIPPQPYVHLHVTLLSTTAKHPNSEYFNLPANQKVPTTVLTTYDAVRSRNGKEPEFNSLSYHGLVRKPEEGVETEYLVKIFSQQEISDEWLANMFSGKVGWVHRKLWQSYPILPPTTSFPSVILDDGLYYVNAMEPFISTMETMTIASRNVVDLLLGREYGTHMCGVNAQSEDSTPHKQPTVGDVLQYWKSAIVEAVTPSTAEKEFIYGWDC